MRLDFDLWGVKVIVR